MEIRRLDDADRNLLRAIRLEMFPEDAGLEWPLDECLSPAAAAFGAPVGEALAGYAVAGFRSHAEGAWDRPAAEQRIAYLEEWYVRPAHRGQGVGRALVEAVEGWARARHATHLASDTEWTNEASVAAHAALGLVEVERTVHFLKRLDPAPPPRLPDAAAVELRELDARSGREIMRLRVAPAQLDFVAPNTRSLAEAYLAGDVWVRGVFVGELAVGFAMVSTSGGRHYLWRFMIDHRFQGRGYGRGAMALVIDAVRSMPGADRLYLSYVPAPGGPGPFYAGLGFVDTGRVVGGEREAVLHL